MRHCDEGVVKSFGCRDSLCRIYMQQQLDEIQKLKLVLIFG